MKKQSGFTLIELMVVMAIIAILATAGLSAYTGYIKKARDTTRIADIAALNTIILGEISVAWKAPVSAALVQRAATAANNGKAMKDPLTAKSTCMSAAGTAFDQLCAYYYKVCDSGTGYGVAARFESPSNTAMYTSDDIGIDDVNFFEMGSCKTPCTSTANSPVGCPNDTVSYSYVEI